jgi:hypothetical protein
MDKIKIRAKMVKSGSGRSKCNIKKSNLKRKQKNAESEFIQKRIMTGVELLNGL